MQIIYKRALSFLLLAVILAILTACSRFPVSSQEKKAENSIKTPTSGLFYDYDLLYAYRDIAYDRESFGRIAGLLQSKETLAVKDTNYADDDGILQINYSLQLTETEPDYKINFTKQMQDAIVLFAIFDYIKGIEFNYQQADHYTFGGVPIMRADAEALLGEQTAPLGSTRASFVEEFPPKVQAVVWKPEVMDTVNYYHAMGLDE
jgi:hypothetical protein